MKRLVLICLIFIVACGNGGNVDKMQSPHTEGQGVGDVKSYDGTYLGIVPCADCEGIEVTLWLQNGEDFTLKTRHIVGEGVHGDIHFRYEGKYTAEQNTNKITLHGLVHQPDMYLFEDGNLIQLDINGKRIAGPLAERYILKRQ